MVKCLCQSSFRTLLQKLSKQNQQSLTIDHFLFTLKKLKKKKKERNLFKHSSISEFVSTTDSKSCENREGVERNNSVCLSNLLSLKSFVRKH